MTNSPPTFQNMMNDVLKDVIDKGIVIVFIDDILIFTEDEEHHDEIVEEIAVMTPDSRKMSVPNVSKIYKQLLWSEGSIVCTH